MRQKRRIPWCGGGGGIKWRAKWKVWPRSGSTSNKIMIRIHIQIRIKVISLIQIRIRIRMTVMLIHNTGVMFKELPVPLYIRDAWQRRPSWEPASPSCAWCEPQTQTPRASSRLCWHDPFLFMKMERICETRRARNACFLDRNILGHQFYEKTRKYCAACPWAFCYLMGLKVATTLLLPLRELTFHRQHI